MGLALSLALSALSGVVIILGGVLFNVRRQWEKKYLDIFIALGAGYILAVALLDMIPEVMHSSPHMMAFVILGYLTVHLFEHVFTPHFHYGEETHDHLVSHVVGTSALVGLAVHNFFSGVAIGSGMLTGSTLGWLIFWGTVLHKLPEGFTISSIMHVSHHGRRHGLMSTITLAIASVLGTLMIFVLESPSPLVRDAALSLSAGTFIHVATTDLIPRINDSPHRWMPLIIFVGVGLFFLSSTVFHL